ncbi:ABC transporter ATP-binding protein [Variovorax sp. UMC13]|uniref:ABC transporter ATP-binding protein n=1 Tax=Variovorax sp. UMC13 TaxID=1862326 RepID=UPI001602CE59|nr:ABC transporter ATP-binding protein [Variovorax sp. UMC13]MBB1604105.1 peptide ABC transporter ATP-binding protein [Variovorax sp. UMC13]
MSTAEPVLQVRGLRTEFLSRSKRWFPVVNEVDLQVRAGETLAVVGESGCGKSMLAYSIMRLLPKRIARNGGGQVLLRGRDLLALGEPQMRAVRGKDISMVFQEPMTSLNPLMTVGRQILESVVEHERCTPEEAHRRVIDLMDLVGIPEPEARFHQYPHHLSGGMRQRIVIAIALACRPQVLIADEPTTALDVTIQAQVLELIDRLKRELGMGVILITHDLGVVAEWSQRVMVMYAGRKVEEADAETFFSAPAHPYSRALLASVPRPDMSVDGAFAPLTEIRGAVPPLDRLGAGCAFAQRCDRADASCTATTPPLQTSAFRAVACFKADATDITSSGTAHAAAIA